VRSGFRIIDGSAGELGAFHRAEPEKQAKIIRATGARLG
jgi:hypothetical protein